MKLSIVKKVVTFCSMLAIALSSCLKDKEFDKGAIQSLHNKNVPKIIEIALTANNTKNFLNYSLPNNTADTTFAIIPVVLSADQPAQEDIQITLVKDDALVAAFNIANGTELEVPASALFTIDNPGNVVTIAKGSYTGYLRIKVKPTNFLGKEYALGFSIGSVKNSGYIISGNLKSGVAKISVKNQYEASYHAVGFFNHPTAPRDYDQDKYLASVDANTVEMELGDLGPATTIFVKINPDNTVTITPGPNATANTAAVAGDATYNNTYDPATQTFRLKYAYTTSAPRTITEILTRQ